MSTAPAANESQPKEAQWVGGFCYCGDIKFEVNAGEVDTPMRGFCHCESCRRAHSAPIYQYCYVKKEHLRITAGAEKVKEFAKSADRPIRCFCSNCGSRVFNYLPVVPEVVGFFPCLLEEAVQHDMPASLRPCKHVHCGEAVLDLAQIHDGLVHRED
jgi:hypothetical protein